MDPTDPNNGVLVGGRIYLSALNNPLDNCRVCHAFVYDKELSSGEVTTIFNSGVPADLLSVGPTSNLVLWSALGDGDAVGSGNINDLSTNANDGTYTNGDSGDFVSDVPDPPITGAVDWWSFAGIWWLPGGDAPELGP